MSTSGAHADLWLKKGGDRRLRGGHAWVYSNEVDTGRGSLANFEAGQPVTLRTASGDSIGSAYMDPHSLICARRYSRETSVALDEAFFCQRLQAALALRQRFFAQPCYRLVYGDSDGLSGIVIDRFHDYLVLQLNNAGIERYEQPLLAALIKTIAPAGVLLRADSRVRREAGLADRNEALYGQVPEFVELEENEVRFRAPVHGGQKTGWFYDHRVNRAWLRSHVAGARVLDVYSYIGAWGIQAAVFGASQVCCVDSSAPALAAVQTNAALNGVAGRVSCLQGNADAVLRDLITQQQQFDVVVLDPPAFVQRKRDLAKGATAYRRINELGLRLLAPGGLLVAASCSMHFSEEDLLAAMRGASQRRGRQLQVVGLGHQGPDHPVHAAIAETRYLKAVFAIATRAD